MQLQHWSRKICFGMQKKDYEKQLEDLRNMENEFAACFPENIDFMKISLETVQNAIPDDTAVVEYFLTVDQYGQMQSEDRNEVPSVFDVYITTKKSGCCSLRRITISGGMEIATDARNFVWIMQRISQGEASIEERLKSWRHCGIGFIMR